MFQGYRKGFIKMFTTMVFFIAVAVLVFIVNPYVSEFLKENTPIYKMIQENIEASLKESFTKKITEQLETVQGEGGAVAQGEAEEAGATAQSEEEAAQGEEAGEAAQGEEAGVAAQVEGIVTQAEEIFEAGTMEEELAMIEEVLGLLDQKELIEGLNVPEILKKSLISNNNEESYANLYVTNFTEYLSAYIAMAIVNIISYVATMILVIIIVKTAIMALDAAANLPVLRGVNRLMGVAVGFGQGVLTLWVSFLIITIFSQTEIGKQLIQMIIESPILNYLYNYNIFLKYLL